MARRPHVMTPKRKAALRKAQLASAKARKGKKTRRSRKIYGQTKNRPAGVSGLRKTTTPYVRVNKRSQTAGVNAGTIIPGTGKRVAFGGYIRVESTTRKTSTDRAISRALASVAPKGSKRGKTADYLRKNTKINTPGIRVSTGKAQVRLGTSRGAGPTVVVRRGKHKTPQTASQKGIISYEKRMRKIQEKKRKPRAQRRRK